MGKSSTKEDRSTKRKSAEKTKFEKVKQSTDFKKEKSKKNKVKSEKKDKKEKSKSKKDKKEKDKSKKDKSKKDKSNTDKVKKDKTTQPSAPADHPIATGNSSTPSGWNNWAAAEFDNDDRKQKFLRFMGVKPGASPSNKQGASPFASAITKEGAGQIHKELEKQFGAGIDQRRQGMRGGLGF
ncbi:hypothetical protein IW147_003959 [Coemansia sp. RSA 720]|nr:hypothetical protein IW147_003959 [Coemansia sp. RSA 720]